MGKRSRTKTRDHVAGGGEVLGFVLWVGDAMTYDVFGGAAMDPFSFSLVV